MNRRLVVIGTVVASALGMSALVLVGGAAASSSGAARYGVINATVDASTDHEVGTSTAFPNYTHGAVDNYYSLAHSHIDNAPFAEGTASPADSGPLGQTGASQASYQQPQYADARWPGAKAGQTASFGSSGGPNAYATAESYKATALSSEASANGAPGGNMKIAAPKGFAHRLHLVLAVWKARWLAPLHLNLPKPNFAALPVTVPVTVPTIPGVTVPTVTIPTVPSTTTTQTTTTTSTTPSSAPQNGGLVSTTLAELDPKSRAIVLSGRSSSAKVTIASGGQIVLKNVDVSVKIVNAGKPKGTVSIKVGGATVGGVPVTIDQNGVHVVGQSSGLPFGKADAQLNQALKTAGVKLYTVKPQTKKSANELMIDATGVHVEFVQPVDQSGVPSQSVDHIVGEVFADSLASPASPVPKLSFGGGGGSQRGGSGAGGSTGSSGGSSFGGGGGSSSSGSGTGTTPASFLTAALAKPWWLLVAYLVWQTIVIATGATLWRWRAGAVT